MNYTAEFWAIAHWLAHDVFPPAEDIRNLTFIGVAVSLGWVQSLTGEKSKRRSLLAAQLLQAVRELKRFTTKPAAERPALRIDGIERVNRLLESTVEPGLLNKKQRGAVETFKQTLISYTSNYGHYKIIGRDEKAAFRQLVGLLCKVLVSLDSSYSKVCGGLAQNLLGALTVADEDIPV